MNNPFQIKSESGNKMVDTAGLKLSGSNESLVGANGEINAGSKRELSQKLVQLSKSNIVAKQDKVTAREKNKQVIAAFDDKNGSSWAELGAALASTLYESQEREGFMRKFLFKAEVDEGSIVRHKVKSKNVTATIIRGPGQLDTQIVRDKYLYPEEFQVSANLEVAKLDIHQGSDDILEEKLLEAQEAIMVTEDRLWKESIDANVGIANELQFLTGGLTPENLSVLKDKVERWNLPVQSMLISSDVMSDITGSTEFGSWFDPVSQYEIVKTGKIGSLLGMDLMTDAYRNPQLKVLDQGEVILVSDPEFHGAYTDRGPVQSTATEGAHDGKSTRGWFLEEFLSMTIHNPRSLVKGKVI